jgi:hypothetical protein
MLLRPIRKPQPAGNSAFFASRQTGKPDRLTAWMHSPALIPLLLGWLSGRPLLRLFRGLIVVYIYMLVLLPSGSLLGVNVKVLCFLSLLPVAAQVSFARGQITVGRLVSLLSIPAILLLWVFLSVFYGFDFSEGFAQYKDLLVTMVTCWFAAVLCADDQADTLFLLRAILYAEVSASVLKILLLGYAFARGIPVSVLIELIHTIFGVQLMAFDFETALGRVQFISDNLIPICIFAILCYRQLLGLRGGRALLMIFVLAVSDLFSFSRYLWVFTVVALVLGLIVGRKDRFQVALIAILTGLTLISLPFLLVIIALRFSTTVVTSSDADRIQQVAALRVFIADAPWFGHGLGSYTHRVIRSLEAPYSYEAQLLALFGQMGLVGVAYLCVLTISYFRRLWPSTERSGLRRAGLLVLLLGWFAGGFFNPSVISSAASISYCAIYAMAALRDQGLAARPQA